MLFYDADGRGGISEQKEYAFTKWGPTAGRRLVSGLGQVLTLVSAIFGGCVGNCELVSSEVVVIRRKAARTVYIATSRVACWILLAAGEQIYDIFEQWVV